MTSSTTLPTAANDYAAPDRMVLNPATWDAALTDIGRRLREAEAIRATFEALIETGTDQALAVIQANVAPQLQLVNQTITDLNADLAQLEDQIAQLTGGGTGNVSPLLILQDATHRFVTDAQIADFAARVTSAQLSAAVSAAVNALANGAPGALDTLKELADAIGDDANFGASVTAALAKKLDFESLGDASVASASIVDLGAQNAARVLITGTTAVTSFGSGANKFRFLRFGSSGLTLTHNATSLVLPGAANIVTQAGDTAIASSDAAGNWRIRHYSRADGSTVAPLPFGQCRLEYVSSTQLRLDPFNGNKLFIAGKWLTIPSAGVVYNISSGGVTERTNFIYAYDNNGTIALESSTTGRARDATYGHQIKSGDPSRTLVGMAWITVGSYLVDSTRQLVCSYYNRKRAGRANNLGDPSTSSSTSVELGAAVYFLAFVDDSTLLSSTGYCRNDTFSGYTYTNLIVHSIVEGTGSLGVGSQFGFTMGNGNPWCSAVASGQHHAPADGLYRATIWGAAGGGGASYWPGNSLFASVPL